MECVKVCEYLQAYGGYPGKYVRDVYNNMSIIMRQRTANKFINSCTLCGLCEEVCPTDFDMGEVNLEARRSMVAAKKMPISAHDFALRDMAYSNSEAFSATIPPADGQPCRFAFFPGCQLAASNPEYIPLIYQDLKAQFPGLGVMLRCCGAPAEWSGEEAIFTQAAGEFRTAWISLGKPRLLLACSSCHQMIKKILPESETMPIWGLLQKDVPETKTRNFNGKRFAIHDPCTSRYEKDWQDAIRSQLSRMGVEMVELELSRNKTECCGYGGVAWLANPDLVHRIIQRRIHENETDYLTYCVMCRDLFSREGKPTLHILDLLYGEDPENLAKRRTPDYSQRHENRYRVKQKMLKMMSRRDFEMPESHLKIKLAISDDVRKILEDRLILVEDVQKAIEHILESGECFVNQTTGHTLGFYRPNLITYWVEFTREGDVFTILDAYSHRMQVGGETHV
jgi:Fe-S oxidoreductase